ncbi:MAG: alpha/beta hydrolase [Dehalococcoidia bacterium]|nr:alpha/beta hydrolase [Dehalococcoidia bacterium]
MASEQLQVVLRILQEGREARGDATPDVATMRANMEAVAAKPAPDVKVEPAEVEGVPAEWVRAPGATAGTALLYLHGGGYVMGSCATHRDLAARISRAAGGPVLLLDYRLAPEHPFPAAVDDATAAYRWLVAQGFAPAKLAIAGDSAGGGLAAATLLALRDASDPLPAAGVLISPWTDLANTGRSLHTRADLDPMVAKEGLADLAGVYLNGTDPQHPYASPLYDDLSGLPPLLVQVGTAEALFDDGARFAGRACEAGVTVTFEPWEEMIHVWHAFAPILPEGQAAIDRLGAFLRERWTQ